MQEPEEAEASIPTENVIEGPNTNLNSNGTSAARRKAAKRSLPWDLSAGELDLAPPPPPPQTEVIPAAKRPRLEEPITASTRLEEPINASTDEAATNHDTSLPAAATAADADNAGADSAGADSAGVDSAGADSAGAESADADSADDDSAYIDSADDDSAGDDSADADAADSADDAAAADDDDAADSADADSVKGSTRASNWTSEEDAKLSNAVTSTRKKKHGKEYRIDWVAVAALFPRRATSQCRNRWHSALDPKIDRANERMGKWTVGEDNKLKDAVQMCGGKKWDAIAALVPDRTKVQCSNRWHHVLDPNLDRANESMGEWTAVEDSKLKDAVQRQGDQNWGAIAALVLGRTRQQCRHRWQHVNKRTGKWSDEEDVMLRDAVETCGGKDWGVIAALVPGRAEKQCWRRWHNSFNPKVVPAGRPIKWAKDEDTKLKDAVQKLGDKRWKEIAALVPGRTTSQCRYRWHSAFAPNIGRANERTGKWTEEEDSKLKDAVQTNRGKNWVTIAELVPGRGERQCWSRWKALDVALTAGSTGRWTKEEDMKLKTVVQTHGGKNWAAVAVLVPGRTEKQCWSRWHHVLNPSIDRTPGRRRRRRSTWTAATEDEGEKLKDAVLTHGGKHWDETNYATV
jgi:hypothetical protein